MLFVVSGIPISGMLLQSNNGLVAKLASRVIRDVGLILEIIIQIKTLLKVLACVIFIDGYGIRKRHLEQHKMIPSSLKYCPLKS